MLNNITLSRYINIYSIIHSINSLIKLISVITITISLLVSNNIYFQIIILIYTLIILILSNISIKEYFKSIHIVLILILFLFGFNLVLKVSLLDNIIQNTRLLTLMIYSNIIVMTTSNRKIENSLKILLKPLKIFNIDVNELSFIISLTIKFIPLVLDVANRNIKNLQIYGINYYNMNIKNKILILRKITIPIFYICIKKATDISDIMEFRMYNLNNNIEMEKINSIDLGVVILNFLILLVAIMW